MTKSNFYLILTLVFVFLLAACKSTYDREKMCRTVKPEDVFSCLQDPDRKKPKKSEKQQKEIWDIE